MPGPRQRRLPPARRRPALRSDRGLAVASAALAPPRPKARPPRFRMRSLPRRPRQTQRWRTERAITLRPSPGPRLPGRAGASAGDASGHCQRWWPLRRGPSAIPPIALPRARRGPGVPPAAARGETERRPPEGAARGAPPARARYTLRGRSCGGSPGCRTTWAASAAGPGVKVSRSSADALMAANAASVQAAPRSPIKATPTGPAIRPAFWTALAQFWSVVPCSSVASAQSQACAEGCRTATPIPLESRVARTTANAAAVPTAPSTTRAV